MGKGVAREFGQRPVQQPPVADAEISQAIGAKVEPWMNLAEFFQTCEGVQRITYFGYPVGVVCSCRGTPERYQWRQNVRRLHPLARPFFGLYEDPQSEDGPKPKGR